MSCLSPWRFESADTRVINALGMNAIAAKGARIAFVPWCLSTAGILILLLPTRTAAATLIADAVEKSDRAAIGTLVGQGADVNAPQADGMTALHWAAHLDDLETARLLVKAGADGKAPNHYGVAPTP